MEKDQSHHLFWSAAAAAAAAAVLGYSYRHWKGLQHQQGLAGQLQVVEVEVKREVTSQALQEAQSEQDMVKERAEEKKGSEVAARVQGLAGWVLAMERQQKLPLPLPLPRHLSPQQQGQLPTLRRLELALHRERLPLFLDEKEPKQRHQYVLHLQALQEYGSPHSLPRRQGSL